MSDISTRIDRTTATLHEVKDDIIRAVGPNNYAELGESARQILPDDYNPQSAETQGQRAPATSCGRWVRISRIFSEDITSLERTNVGMIITRSKTILLYSFWAVVVFALFFSQQIVRNIGGSLRQIVDLTKAISKGNYQPIDQKPSRRRDGGGGHGHQHHGQGTG